MFNSVKFLLFTFFSIGTLYAQPLSTNRTSQPQNLPSAESTNIKQKIENIKKKIKKLKESKKMKL
ncbi:hypothetical protein HCUR_00221 [Holospora curviuscula]|uniref:Uncharacterized protein n=2 Tax=Holospora curviuscula TaxID=1082868 RepID=A0A2S5REL5_9PROT|nr:hypothetical protein HCUR_00221 [Holospora curviuscula]